MMMKKKSFKELGGPLHNKLLQILCDYIADSSPGRRLPSENALSNKYKIARMTVRKVLNQLAQEGKIARRQGSGSFVAARPIFTFCLPCEDFFSYNDFSAYMTRLQMKGAIRAAQERNIRFETVAMSRTNNCMDLDYMALSHINRASHLLLSPWFRNLFEMLCERHAKVCLLHTNDIPYGYHQYTRNWLKFELDRNDAVKQIFLKMRAMGCRRIALATHFVLSEKNHAYAVAYQNMIQIFHQEKLIFEVPNGSRLPVDLLKDFYRKNRFDGLIFSGFNVHQIGSIQKNLGIPESIPVYGIDCPPELYPLLDRIPYCMPDYEQIGYDAVTMLMDERNSGTSRVYSYKFFD